mmetsp:Transcript_71499/g.155306  ORF Transcript_71499/g.155306 Transcript_71499/m.155306 type:complete len:213 (-) Transcript_71499:96-734(-)
MPSISTLGSLLTAISLDSSLHILMPLNSVLWPMKPRRIDKDTVSTTLGSTLDRRDPKTAPKMVRGSMMRIKSQSMSPFLSRGCRFGTFTTVFAMEPPRIVKLESAMACFGRKPSTRMKRGTRIPPPPIPPLAAMMRPTLASRKLRPSWCQSRGKAALWYWKRRSALGCSTSSASLSVSNPSSLKTVSLTFPPGSSPWDLFSPVPFTSAPSRA